MEVFQVVPCPTTDLSYTNKAILSPHDSFSKVGHIAIRYPKGAEAFVFSVTTDSSIPKGKIAFNLTGRKWASLMLNSHIEAAPYEFQPRSQCLNAITFFTDFASRQNSPKNIEFDTEEMSKQFSQQFRDQAFTVGQLFGFSFQFNNKRIVFELKVKELEALNMEKSDVATSNVEIGLTTPNTIVTFERAEGSEVKLIGGMTGKTTAPKLFNQDWDFSSMGVGGLSQQFNKIFRRAFASRLLPPHFVQAMGAEHVRGILLYGPPGTGKTLIARQIGNMLLAREPKIVNGPEVLNKFVGESEANIRKLFAEAEEEQAKAGINSGLHMIIFDEIDAICKARGSSPGSAGVGDNVVNQLLSKIDGVNSLHNVLLVGMTNRKDLIDEALLRPGRLEVQIEIGLPNKEGRLEILKIHTKKMQEIGVLDSSVSLEDLAERTKNYTGAEIAGLIKAARSLAVNRVVKADSKREITRETLDNIKITPADFDYAMQHDVKPALGASEDQLKFLAKPMIIWDSTVSSIQSDLELIITEVSNPEQQQEQPYHVLMVGEAGVGLTTVAANMASDTKFPFIRVCQAKNTAGKTESARVAYMEKLFDDAAKSELSCVILDDLEYLMDYCRIGPRFSNAAKAVFIGNKDTELPQGHKMLIICTCHSEQFLQDVGIEDVFDWIIRVPSLTKPNQVQAALGPLAEMSGPTFTPQQTSELLEALGSLPFKMGIKKLQKLVRSCANCNPDQRVRKFLEHMHSLKLVVRPSKLDQFEF